MIRSIRVSDLKSGVEYALIIALYYVAGGAFSYTAYSTQITVFFLVAFVLCVLGGNINKLLQEKVFLVLFFESIFLLLVPILNFDGFTSYIAIIMQLFIGAFCAAIIPLENFRYKYIRIMAFFASVSLVGYVLAFIYPQIIFYFPVIIGEASVDYYNAFIYVFMTAKGYGATVLTTRNAGICWEPGCYQAFLNIALFFLLSGEERKQEQRFTIFFFILAITIFSTLSTTGIILMALTLMRYWKVWLRRFSCNMRTLLITFILLVGVALILIQSGIIVDIIQKINKEFFLSGSNAGSAMDRISINKIGYIFVGGFWFFGMSFPKWLTFGETLWNSVIHSFLCLGTPFTLIHLYAYWRGSRRLAYGSSLLFILMVASASTETLFWRVFFNTMAFYGVMEPCYALRTRRNTI